MYSTVYFYGSRFDLVERFDDGTVWIRDPFSATELVVHHTQLSPN